ncbi:breast carcinoma-amplified sequence 1 homolog isoform 1 [Mus musculus]|uniref:Breast carcinoma-amplified sequence 1 homolog n=2 Tax=Mus musculus TaxID=10090 RepID=BCAS1_MOUSE|nr:breast carcinoma-amplified sequence 1 homolog isoform 1 [Mus musculus]Q80YN3.3 RecName: Full=Breast carcinoma-amplified sequence 1 homolog; AltName: Full=Novel amplified in breast cancer 1 homolog [Mus musculus]|eukprot:NP_084091.2 breast carcinoma-amplified sequence 1 homolog isoform 1 [Mus musculus]
MGNQMSVPLRPGDQEHDPGADTCKVTSDNECVQNGNPVVLSTRVIQHYEEVDLGISSSKDNVATSSPKTMEAQAVGDASGKNLGKEAKTKAPAARSHFFLTLSRPVPGRPGDQGTDSSAASGRFDVSPSAAPENKDPSEHGALPVAAAPGQAPDKTPGCPEAKQQTLPATGPLAPSPPESQAEAPAQDKDFGFLNRFFKLDKGRESAPVNSQPKEAKGSEDPEQATEAPAVPGNPHGVSAGEDIVDSEQRGQDVDTLSYSVPGDPEVPGTTKEDPQVVDTTENSSSIMSFFKTLVSPNKTETKKDPEDTKATKADSVCDGHAAGQKMSETQAKSKKKRLDSPRLGLSFRKLFRHKDTENSPTTSANLKSDKANFTPQETRGKTKATKSCSPPPPPPEPTSEGRDSGKEKAGPTSLPLGKLFWKKSVKEDTLSTGAEENAVCESPVETVRLEEVESSLQTVDLSEETQPEPTDVKVKEESKPRKTPLMAFLRQMSVRSSEGIPRSEESNVKDSSCQTSNSVEKTPSPPEPEPAGTAQKNKETSSSKDKKSVDKKSATENSKQKNGKQEVREPAPCVQPPTVEANAMQTGDKTPKKSEKRRQSLGGFLKGLGPKRMSDAQVQTDPVSIGPVGKSK